MKLILLSGGSGKRLWPMSNDSRSKQFLRVLPHGDDQAISMLQRVWGQLNRVGLTEHSFVCASKAQQEMIYAQLGKVPVIVEPERRDTFPAIALAVAFLLDRIGCDEQEPIVVMPVDHFVDDAYFEQLAKLDHVLEATSADLVLLGVKPTAPSSQFGYMTVEKNTFLEKDLLTITSFIEKPEADRAQLLIEQGALWNCGVFCFRPGFLRDRMKQKGYATSYEAIASDFRALPKRSFDYEIVEQVQSIAAIPYEGTWKDLGTWSELAQEVGKPLVGLGTAEDCANTYVINELGIPIVAMGLRDAVVVATPDGILVSDLKESAKIKNAVAAFDQRPMMEERFWGNYRVLDYSKLDDGTEVITKMLMIHAGRTISYHKHMHRTENWTIVAGRGEIVIGTNLMTVQTGDVLRAFPDQWHAIRATETMQIIEVQQGQELVEEDILRRFDHWQEMVDHIAHMAV